MSLTKVTYSMINGAVFNVLDYGAVGDGVANDTASIQAAIDAAQAAAQTNSLVVFYGTAPTVFFPSGIYKITAPLLYYAYSRFAGERSLLTQATAGQDIFFSDEPYQNEWKGLIFEAGAVQIHIQNGTNPSGGLESVVVHIEDCEFYNNTDYAIKCVKTGVPLVGGEMVNISNCRAYSFAQFLYSRFDMVNLSRSYLATSATEQPANSAWINVGVNANISEVVFVPAGGYTTPGYRYIDNYTEGALVVTSCRFGGEGGGIPIVYNFTDALVTSPYPYQGGSAVILEDNPIFVTGTQTDQGAIVAKTGLPKVISIQNNSQGAIGPIINTANFTGAISLATYLAGYDANTPYLSYQIRNNGVWATDISSSAADTNLLRPYLDFNTPDQFKKNNNLFYLETRYQKTKRIEGFNYAQTSTSTTTSIVDTGITYDSTSVGDGEDTADLGYGRVSIYDVFVSGNPNLAGAAVYKSNVYGQVFVWTALSGGTQKQIIQFTQIANPATTFTVTAAFWDGASETTVVPDGATNAQIRIKVDGYVNNTGQDQLVKIIKRT
jgi:hypothetical protein